MVNRLVNLQLAKISSYAVSYAEMNHIPRIFYPVRDCMLVALKPFYPFFFPVGAA